MSSLIGYVLAAFLLSTVLVLVCRSIARRFGFVARPRSDRWHGRPTALLGGVAIALTVLALHVLLLGVSAAPVLLLSVGAIFILGLIDDLVSLRPVTKIVMEIGVASFLVYYGYRLGWTRSLTLDTLLTLFWIVGLTNAFNLLDNMDGLAAGLCLVAGGGLLAALAMNGVAGPESLHLALLIGAVGGFLIFNFQPASIFMGDSGSLFIGLNLSILTLTSPSSTQAPTSLLAIMAAPVMTLMVPILDTTLVTTSRLLSGRSAAQGGRDHSSHRLVAIGLSERTAVFVLWGLSALGGAVGLALQHYRTDLPGLVAALLFLAVIIFAVFLARVRVYEDSDEVMTRKDRLTPLVVNFVFRRRIAEVFLDLCLVPIAYYAAYRLRFDRLEFGRHFPRFLETLPLIVGVQLVSLAVVGGYRGVWQYFGLMDGVTFAKGVGLATLVNVLLVIASGRFEPYFVSIFVVFAALLMLMLAGSRASFRLISEFANRRNQSGTRVLIYGDGDVGASAARDILGRRLGGYRMLGFIVTDPTLERTRMQGYPVLGGLPALISLIEAAAVDLIVITQALGEDVEAEIRAACSTHGVALERLHITLEPVESPVIRT